MALASENQVGQRWIFDCDDGGDGCRLERGVLMMMLRHQQQKRLAIIESRS
jgi:hypothetical protein